jgi:hypothetical protein
MHGSKIKIKSKQIQMDVSDRQFLTTQNDSITVATDTRDKMFKGFSGFAICFIIALLILTGANPVSRANGAPRWWSDAAESALVRAGTNRRELVKALGLAPAEQREGMEFLIENMPERDLQSLSSNFLLDNLTMAYAAMEAAPWASEIPTDIFLNEVLPYASVSEPRDNWRQRLSEISLPLIKDCKTPAEACKVLNEQIFKLLDVKYSTTRRAPDQGPFETMETGVATCTGLSILLVNACRSVGIPARVVGTPLWSNNSGNHTWIEVWDGEWLFTGAAEQSPEGFNRGWFVNNASQAVKDERRYAIYASSFKKTDISFPMVWARDADYVSAVNVTDRYTQNASTEVAAGMRLMVDVFDRPVGERVAARVTITDTDDQTVNFEGTSRGATADMNDHLFLQLPKQRTYLVEVEYGNQRYQQYYTSRTTQEDRLPIFLSGIPEVPAISENPYTPPVSSPLPAKDNARLREAFSAYFSASAASQANWKFPRSLEKLLRENEQAVRMAAWESYLDAPIHDSLKKDFDSGRVRFKNHESPYTVKTVGERPENGWALFIAMHGGGNTTQEFNDRQWRHMQIYYRDQPQAGGYIYVALRAPDNTWNGFYTDYVYPLIQNLLRQFMIFGDIDPGKKFIMGYSHGGYGAFAIGPKMPDYFAAIHSSAAAPADGADPATLRNTVFTTMVGGKDTMYGRYDRTLEFERDIRQLRGDRTDIFPVTVQIVDGHPHSGLPDRDKIAEMYPNRRNPVPRELTWQLTDTVIGDFFWLHAPVPEPGKRLEASCSDNKLMVTTDLPSASILLDSRLIDFNRPVTLELNGTTSRHRLKPGLRTLCETMQRRGDPELSFTVEVPLHP